MFFYPLNIALILLGLLSPFGLYRRRQYQMTMFFVAIAAFGDFIKALPASISGFPFFTFLLSLYERLPLFSKGLGWLVPMGLGFFIGFLWCFFPSKKL